MCVLSQCVDVWFLFFCACENRVFVFFYTADLLFLRWNSFWWLTSNLYWCILKGHILPTNVEVFHLSENFQRRIESTSASDSAAFTQSRAIWKKNRDTARLKTSRTSERRARCSTTDSALLALRSICQTDGVFSFDLSLRIICARCLPWLAAVFAQRCCFCRGRSGSYNCELPTSLRANTGQMVAFNFRTRAQTD